MTKRVAWFTCEPDVKDTHTPYKVYEVFNEKGNWFTIINDKGFENYCLKKGCSHLNGKDWVFADVKAIPVKTKKWGEWIENTTGKCPEGLKRKQKIKLKWSDGSEFNITRPHNAAWYFSQGYNPVNITHYKVKLKDQLLDKQEKPESKWTKNTGVCPVEGNITVMMKFSDGTIAKTQAQEYCWDLGQSRKIIKWRLAD